MNQTDFLYTLHWWAILFGMGILFTPLTFRLFDSFFDKGYIFAKAVGLLIVGYIIFALGALHLVPFTTPAILAITILTSVVSVALLPQKWKVLVAFQKKWFIFLFEELLFFTMLCLWATIHAYAPDIHGLEKYMDYGFINSFLRSDYLPAKDMWFTPYVINYYYFGHLLTALLTKLSGIPSAITFNLMLSTIFALCFSQTFSIGINLYHHAKKQFTDSLWHTLFGIHQDVTINATKTGRIRLVISGLLTASLVTLAGNLHILYAFFTPYKTETPQPLWQLLYNPLSFPNSYWYPNATRFIHNTIHEFPIYSWVVADLHGHVLDIPFVLLAIALSLSLILNYTNKPKEEFSIEKTWKIHPLLLIFFGLLLSCMYMTNAWDGAIYFMLVAGVLWYIHSQWYGLYKKHFSEEEDVSVIKNRTKTKRLSLPPAWKMIWGRDYLLSLLLIVTSFFIFTTPYNMHFKPFVSGIGVLCAPTVLTNIGKLGPLLFEAGHCQHSPWWQLLTLYGFFYFFVAIYMVWTFRTKTYKPTDIFVLILIFLATILIILPEFIYVKDIYPAHYRANTMFKLVFQAFMMLSIASGYIIVRSFAGIVDLPWGKKLVGLCYVIITTCLLYLVFTYPYMAIKSYYGDLKTYQGLDGTTYLKTLYRSDYEAISWLNTTIVGQPVILEAQGDSYTDFGRVSTNTGLPTVLGWTVHEWLWRGTYGIPAPRIEEIRKMYESSDITETMSLLKKYKVQYVFVGSQERIKYPNLQQAKFDKIGTIVFRSGSTTIYHISL